MISYKVPWIIFGSLVLLLAILRWAGLAGPDGNQAGVCPCLGFGVLVVLVIGTLIERFTSHPPEDLAQGFEVYPKETAQQDDEERDKKRDVLIIGGCRDAHRYSSPALNAGDVPITCHDVALHIQRHGPLSFAPGLHDEHFWKAGTSLVPDGHPAMTRVDIRLSFSQPNGQRGICAGCWKSAFGRACPPQPHGPGCQPCRALPGGC